jgi:nucleoside-diphosphate-sugar epimerase
MVVQEDSVLGMLIRGEGDDRYIQCLCDTSGTPLRRTIVHRDDVVSGLVAMLGNERALGQTFHLSGPAFSFEEAAQYLAEKTDLPVRPVETPEVYSFDIDTSHTTECVGWTAQYDVKGAIQAALDHREAQP